MISRSLVNRVDSWLFKGKIIVMYGPMHVGKTSLCKRILKTYQQETGYISCARHSVRSALQSGNFNDIKTLVSDHRLIVLDDAEGIPNMGDILLMLHEQMPDLQIIVAASNQIELSTLQQVAFEEKSIGFNVYPLSLLELQATSDPQSLDARLGEFLRFGLCPAVLSAPVEERKEMLLTLSEDFLYKDLLQFESLKNANKIGALLKYLAEQVGNELSIHEIAASLDFSRSTVERFIKILEKTFVIIKAPSFNRHCKRELNNKAKYYFYDLGFRNALLGSTAFDPLDRNPDVEALWENFCVLERLKFLHLQGQYPNIHFWRTHDRQKLGYVEDRKDMLRAFDFKWQPQRNKNFITPKAFEKHYPDSHVTLITQQNWQHLFY